MKPLISNMSVIVYAVILLGIASFVKCRYPGGPSLAMVVHAPPGLFDNHISKYLSGNLDTNDPAVLTKQLQSLTSNPKALKSLYQGYKKAFKKGSQTAKEEAMRMEIFKIQLSNVLSHNLKALAGQKSYKMEINRFSDMTEKEVIARYTGFKHTNAKKTSNARSHRINPFQNRNRRQNPPNAIDWNRLGFVSSVKDQEDCGSCTLFSTTAALESAWKIKNGGELMDLSVQELLDCMPTGGACSGNWYRDAMTYQKFHGQGLESDYEYLARKDKCNRPATKAKLESFSKIAEDEDDLKEAVGLFGPVPVTIFVYQPILHYSSGIFEENNCDGDINHSVLAVGYGSENGKDFWIIKNSWGTGWGDNGYIKIRRNFNNLCKITDYAFSVTAARSLR